MSRFVVLLHRPGTKSLRTEQTHADWMFQSGDTLLTWATNVPDDFEHSFCIGAEKLVDHRLRYLDYEGEVSGDRGDVTRLLSGKSELRIICDSELIALMRWTTDNQVHHEATVRLQRKFRESDDEIRTDRWELRFDFGLNETKR